LSWSHIWKVLFWDLNVENLVHLTWNDPKYFSEIMKLMKVYCGMKAELHTFVTLAPDGAERSLLARLTAVGSTRVGISNGLDLQAAEIT
jgi:hypothetical protein